MPRSNDEEEFDSELDAILHKIKPLRIIALILHKIKPLRIIALILIVIGLIMGLAGLTTIDSTQRAVVFHKTDGSLSILDPGYHYVVPIIQSSTKYNVKDRTYTESAIGISLDLQETTTEVTVRYSPDPLAIQTIHQTLGTSYQKKIVVPAVQSCVKNAVSHYNVEQLTGNVRTQVNEAIATCLAKELSDGHLLVSKVSITDFDFSKQFNNAIEAKAIAQQAAQEEKNRLEQVRYQANQTIIKAEAQATAVRLLNEATLAQDKDSNAYLFLEWLKVWNGVLPNTLVGGEADGLIINPPSSG